MQIFVKLANNQTVAININQGQALEQIQNEIERIQGELSGSMSLFCSGKSLLSENQLQSGSIVEQVCEVLGGAAGIPSGVDPAFYALSLKYYM